MKKNRIALKVSGDLLNEENLDINNKKGLINNIAKAIENGIQLVLIVGGGNITRGKYTELDKERKNTSIRISQDKQGMLSTVLNALILSDAISKVKIESQIFCPFHIFDIAEEYNRKKILSSFNTRKIIICAGGIGVPFVSTDTAAVIRSLELECYSLIKLTSVGGIYDKDPNKFQDAKMLEKVSYADTILKGLEVMDIASVVIARDNNLPITICSLENCSLLDILQNNRLFGSIIS